MVLLFQNTVGEQYAKAYSKPPYKTHFCSISTRSISATILFSDIAKLKLVRNSFLTSVYSIDLFGNSVSEQV